MLVTYLSPALLLLIVALAAGIHKRNRRVMTTALALLFLWSWPPAAALFAASLEGWYPIERFPSGDAEAMVVLSGGLYKTDVSLPENLPKPDTYVRVSYASWLYRNWRPLPIVVSGGLTRDPNSPALAEVMRRLLVQQGTPPSMIWLEERSRSTYENALYSAELLRAKGIRRIVLVTEAHHMLRAEKAFRRQGLVVVAAPCAYRYIQFTGAPEQFVPGSNAIELNDVALHEWVGLVWYRVTGKI